MYDNLKEECVALKEKILSSYDETASNYDQKIYENIRNELDENAKQKLYVCYLNQTKRLIPMIQKFMRIDIQKKFSSGSKYVLIYF